MHHSVGWLLKERPALVKFGDTLNWHLYSAGTDSNGINSSKSGLLGNGNEMESSEEFGTG